MSEKESKFTNVIDSVKTAAGKASTKVTDAAGDVKHAVVQLKDAAVIKQNEYKETQLQKRTAEDVSKYSPIFADDIAHDELLSERVIRIVNYDARLENETCKGSIGFYEKSQDRRMPTLYSKYVPTLGLTFYPQMSESIFIADPCIKGKFIEIDEYYNYMKQVRVNELTVVAQALGAKHVEIKLRNTAKTIFRSSSKAHGSAGSVVDVSGSMKKSRASSRSIDIWADTVFNTSGHIKPTAPELLYFRNESDISALIQMVLQGQSRLTRREYSMKASSSSGLSLSEAVSISGVLKKIKCTAGASLEKDAETQSNSILEYTIEF